MKTKFKKYAPFAAFLLLIAIVLPLCSVSSAFTSGNIVGSATNADVGSTFVDEAPDPTCYRKDSSGTPTYYTSFGLCLKEAYANSGADSIYIIPSLKNSADDLNSSGVSTWNKTQVTLTSKYAVTQSYSYDGKTYSQYIISSTDTLYLPYTSETIFTEYQNGHGFIDNNLGNQKNNLTNELVIDSGVLLKIEGNLQIGGVMGGQSGTPDLQNTVQGQYAQISMKQNSKIVYTGTNTNINIYGYIKEYDEANPSDGFDVLSGGVFKMPITLYDWTGGTWAVSILTSYFPILVYDFPSVQTKFRAYYGSTIYAIADVAISGEHFQADVNVISTSNSFFLQMTSNGYIEFDWEPRSTASSTTSGATRTIALTEQDKSTATNGNSTREKISLACNVTMNNLAVSVSSYDMTTADKEIPLSYKIDIIVKDGYTYTIPSSISAKFLPGASLEIEEGATVDFYGGAIAYKNFNEKIRDGSVFYTTKFNVENGGPGAQIINNGTLNMHGSFGGHIQTTNSNGTAHINFVDGCSYSYTVEEGASYTKVGIYFVSYEDVTETVTGDIDLNESGALDSNESGANFNSTDAVKFNSHAGGNFWSISGVTIKINFNTSATNASQLNNYGFKLGDTIVQKGTSSIRCVTSTFTLSDWYGVASFNIIYNDGTATTTGYVPGSGVEINAEHVDTVTAVLGTPYSVSLSVKGKRSYLYNDTQITIDAYVSDNTSIGTEATITVSGSSTYTATGYVAKGGKFKIETPDKGRWESGPTVSGSYTTSDSYYIPTSNITVSGEASYYFL